jgi:hypothetical protein
MFGFGKNKEAKKAYNSVVAQHVKLILEREVPELFLAIDMAYGNPIQKGGGNEADSAAAIVLSFLVSHRAEFWNAASEEYRTNVKNNFNTITSRGQFGERHVAAFKKFLAM